jgi:hypothetical protein
VDDPSPRPVQIRVRSASRVPKSHLRQRIDVELPVANGCFHPAWRSDGLPKSRLLVGACCAFLILIPDPHLIQGSTDGVMEGGPDLADELVLAVGPSAVGEQDHGNSTV